MRNDKLEKELRLLILLTDNRTYTLKQICEKTGISRRSMYYYLEFFRDCGFILEKQGNCYSIDRSSPFFSKIIEKISFTEEEAVVIRRLLGKVESKNAVVEHLKRKMDKFFDFGILASDELNESAASNVNTLHDAIKYERQVVLRGYSSPHSQTKRDRLVEPFMLMDGNREVRCYEPASGLNKTFKVVRMESVDTLADAWAFKKMHKEMFTDIFMFSSEERVNVRLLLGQLSRNLLIEEYPKAYPFLTKQPDKRWLLDVDVCSYIGIGRFVLGLFDDIEVLGDDGFKLYLKKKIEMFGKRIKETE